MERERGSVSAPGGWWVLTRIFHTAMVHRALRLRKKTPMRVRRIESFAFFMVGSASVTGQQAGCI